MAESKAIMKQIFQIVMVVESVDKTMENWKQMVEFDTASIEFGQTSPNTKCIYNGKEINCPTKYATFDLGGVQMKVVEPLDKAAGNPYSDALLKEGPGIHHVGFGTDCYEELLKKYEADGKKPVYEEVEGDNHYVLYDFTDKTGFRVAPYEHMAGPCAR